MKPPFVSSGGATPAPTSLPSSIPGAGSLPAGLPSLPDLPSIPDIPGMPDLPDIPGIPEIPDLPDITDLLPGSCDALWAAVDQGMGAVNDVANKASQAVKDATDKASEAVNAAKEKAQKAYDDAKEAVDRNVEMAKKYAEVYLNDAKQAWAGVSAVIAQQAACAGKALDKIAPGASDAVSNKLGQYADEAGRFVDDGVAKANQAVNDVTNAAAEKARQAEQAVTGYAKDGMAAADSARKQVFDTVYSAAKFAQDNGLDKLSECGSSGSRPEVPQGITDALEQIDKGTEEGIRAGSDMIAQYEQGSIVEKAIYDAEQYRDQGMAELASMADKLKSGLTDAIPLASECGGPPLPFDDSLLDPDAREKYYHKLMNEFESMASDAKDKMMNEIANQVSNVKEQAANAISRRQGPGRATRSTDAKQQAANAIANAKDQAANAHEQCQGPGEQRHRRRAEPGQ